MMATVVQILRLCGGLRGQTGGAVVIVGPPTQCLTDRDSFCQPQQRGPNPKPPTANLRLSQHGEVEAGGGK